MPHSTTRRIPLTQGQFALIDTEDYDRVIPHTWYLHGGKYAVFHTRKLGMVLLHRFILGITDPLIEVDHRDLDGLNCCKDNLRIATHQENQRNRTKYRCNTTGYKGVFRNSSTSKWRAMITVNGKNVHLGYFIHIVDAAKAYDAAASKYFGEFARLNFTPGSPSVAADP
jgi:hypothetical protein